MEIRKEDLKEKGIVLSPGRYTTKKTKDGLEIYLCGGDTEGCILVGVNNVTGKVTNSVATLNILLALIEKYKQDEYTLTIK